MEEKKRIGVCFFCVTYIFHYPKIFNTQMSWKQKNRDKMVDGKMVSDLCVHVCAYLMCYFFVRNTQNKIHTILSTAKTKNIGDGC